ncbi:MAG: MotA/TolQ/ExbB proton channel family protein [Pseudomonadota bacterium]
MMKLGGWVMWPILFSSIAAVSIIAERFWSLRRAQIIPPKLINQVWVWLKNNQIDGRRLRELKQSSPMGRIMAAGLSNANHGREIMKESVDDAVYHEVHQMERFLSALGSIAAISPLMGLLGTVLGMMDVFSSIVLQGNTNTLALAGGISVALLTTAFGLIVAIPSAFFYRFFQRRIDELAVTVEQETVRLIEAVYGQRDMPITDDK